MDTSECEEAQLPCRPPDLDDSFECLDRFVDLARLLENPTERVEMGRLRRGVTQTSRGRGRSAQVGRGVVESLFGLRDVTQEGVEVVHCPVVTEWPHEAVRFGAGSACFNDVAVKECGVGGQDPRAAEVPRLGFVEQRSALVEHRCCPVETATVLDQHERQGRATERRQVRVTARVGGHDGLFGRAAGLLDVACHFEPGDVRQWTYPVCGARHGRCCGEGAGEPIGTEPTIAEEHPGPTEAGCDPEAEHRVVDCCPSERGLDVDAFLATESELFGLLGSPESGSSVGRNGGEPFGLCAKRCLMEGCVA